VGWLVSGWVGSVSRCVSWLVLGLASGCSVSSLVFGLVGWLVGDLSVS
jgi:hypothetical protein